MLCRPRSCKPGSCESGRNRVSMLRRILFWLTVLGVLALIVASATPVFLGWTEPPRYSREVAERALNEARVSGARAWAQAKMGRRETSHGKNLRPGVTKARSGAMGARWEVG